MSNFTHTEGRIFEDNEDVFIADSTVKATVIGAFKDEATGKWKYYLQGWQRPVDAKDLTKIPPPVTDY